MCYSKRLTARVSIIALSRRGRRLSQLKFPRVFTENAIYALCQRGSLQLDFRGSPANQLALEILASVWRDFPHCPSYFAEVMAERLLSVITDVSSSDAA